MRKLQVNTANLQFKKQRIVTLQAEESAQVQGGFTYSLSLGARCKASKAVGAGNNYDCGLILGSIAANQCEVSPGTPN